jgi:hypothetical protein
MGYSGVVAASEHLKSPQGNSWDSIKQLPNWSGVWARYRQPPPAVVTGAGGAQRPYPRGTGGDPVSLTPEYAKLSDDAAAARAQQNLSACLPAGTPGIMQHNVLHEYLFTPGRVTILIEDGEVRRVHTDGRAHLRLDELSGSYMGDSIGHWEGATLVVDTIGFPHGSLWENYGVLATRNTHLVERIFRKDANHMQIDSTMTDPAIFTQPYVFSRQYTRSPLPMTEPMCAQNNRDTGEKVDLTPPPED